MKTRYFKILLFCIATGSFALFPSLYAQSAYPDSLERLLQTQKLTSDERLNLYEKLTTFWSESNLPKAISYAKEGAHLAEKEKNKDMAALLYQKLGSAYMISNQFDDAKNSFEKAIEYAKQVQDNDRENFVYGDMGNMYNLQQSYQLALEYYMKALSYFENGGNELLASMIRLNIAALYENTYNHEKALENLHMVETTARKFEQSGLLARSLSNMASIYGSDSYKEWDRALQYAEEAYQIFDSLKSLRDKSITTQRFVVIYAHHKNEYQKALEWADKGLQIAEELGSDNQAAYSLAQTMSVYFMMNNYPESIRFGSMAAKRDTSDLITLSYVYKIMALCYAYQHNMDTAYDYIDKYDKTITGTAQEDFQRSFSEMEVKYETEKKELKIASMEEERQLMILLSISGGVILLLALAFFIIRHQLAVNKRKMAEQQIKQLEQEKQLIATQAILDGETAERARLARDLHDGLGGMLSVVKLNLNDVKKGASLEGEDVVRFEQALDVLEGSIRELRRVAHNMMPESLTRYGLKAALTDFCNNIPNAEFYYFGDDERPELNLETMAYRAILELVNNALKHADAKRIIVQIVSEPDRLALTVQDDGCGFDLSAVSSGTGIENIRNRVSSYNGNMDIWSKPGKGTEVNLELRIEN